MPIWSFPPVFVSTVGDIQALARNSRLVLFLALPYLARRKEGAGKRSTPPWQLLLTRGGVVPWVRKNVYFLFLLSFSCKPTLNARVVCWSARETQPIPLFPSYPFLLLEARSPESLSRIVCTNLPREGSLINVQLVDVSYRLRCYSGPNHRSWSVQLPWRLFCPLPSRSHLQISCVDQNLARKQANSTHPKLWLEQHSRHIVHETRVAVERAGREFFVLRQSLPWRGTSSRWPGRPWPRGRAAPCSQPCSAGHEPGSLRLRGCLSYHTCWAGCRQGPENPTLGVLPAGRDRGLRWTRRAGPRVMLRSEIVNFKVRWSKKVLLLPASSHWHCQGIVLVLHPRKSRCPAELDLVELRQE